MVVMKKRRDIGILATMGATRESVRRIFVVQGLYIGGIGIVAGVIGGWVVSAILDRYRFIDLPDDVYLIGTLPVRMERHVANTRTVAVFLQGHEAVAEVIYPELDGHPDQALARKLLPRGAGAILSFELVGGREAGRRFIESLRLFSHLANVGDAKSLVIHPASTTHHRMDAAALEAAGISEGLVRISVGLESVDDLMDDLGRALHASQKV